MEDLGCLPFYRLEESDALVVDRVSTDGIPLIGVVCAPFIADSFDGVRVLLAPPG